MKNGTKKAIPATSTNYDYERLLLELSSADWIWEVDHTGTYTYASEKVEEVLGYAPDEIIGKTPFDFMPKDEAERISEIFIEIVTNTQPIKNLENWNISKDGQQVCLLTNAVPLIDEAGELLGYRGIDTDITARKVAEEELQASEERYKTLVENMPDVTWMTRETGETVFISPSVMDVYGYTPVEIYEAGAELFIGRIHPEDVEEVLSSFQSLFTGKGEFNVEFRIKHKEGHWIWLHDRAFKVFEMDGQSVAYGMFTDITTRKDVDSELQRYREHLEELIQDRTNELEQSNRELYIKDLVFESSIAANSTADVSGAIRHANPAFLQTWGYENPDEVLGNPLTHFFANEEDGIPILEALSSTGRWEGEFLAKRKDGTTFIAQSIATALYDTSGELIGYQSSVLDATAEKEAADELQRTLEALERSNQELQQFAYVASHDLQEPLRMVSSFVQLLNERYGDVLDEDASEFIGYAVDGAKRMQHLINDLLEFSRVNSQGGEFKLTDCDMSLKNVLKDLKPLIEDSHAEITSGTFPPAWVDPTQFEQVFRNLIGNAIKFRGDAPPRIDLKVEESDGYLQFSVSDNGIGIDPKYNDRIFVIFQRLNARTEYDGSGIGLSVAKRIVERHGGRIWYESAPGEGTTFTFTIPKRSQ